MMRRRTFLGTASAAVAVCVLPRAASGEKMADTILDRLRSLRRHKRLPDLTPHSALAEMARLQAEHMQRLGCTTHIGLDDLAPPARGLRAGYSGCILGEVVAETQEGPLETLEAWLINDDTRNVLLDPHARNVGLFGLRDRTGLARWDLVMGA